MRIDSERQAKLGPRIAAMAYCIGRYFPEHLMDREDLMQEGWLGVHRATAPAGRSEADAIAVAATAAYRAMVTAVRRWRPTRTIRNATQPKHQLEVLVARAETELVVREECVEDGRLEYRRKAALLSLRERVVLVALLEGKTLKEVGALLGVTESRACQIKSGIAAVLFPDDDGGRRKNRKPRIEEVESDRVATDKPQAHR